LQEEIGILSIDAGSIKFPGKGIKFKNTIHFLPSILEQHNESLSHEVEVHLLHELAKNLIYRFQNYRDILFYGLILSFQCFGILIFINPSPTAEWILLIAITLFLYIIGSSFSIFIRLVDTSRVPRMVIGARVATWNEERKMERAQFAAASHIDSGDDIDMELASEELDKLKKIVEKE
jgi:hypothetical protein